VKRLLTIVIWVAVALLGAGALCAIALNRGEPLNAMWFVLAAVCSYAVAYRV
jgi:carbon starvation protein